MSQIEVIPEIVRKAFSPVALDTLRKMAENYQRQNEQIKRMMDGPMRYAVSAAAIFQKEHEAMQRALENIQLPKLDLAIMKSFALAAYSGDRATMYVPPRAVGVRGFESDEGRRESLEVMKALLEAHKEGNELSKKLLQKQNSKAKKLRAQTVVFDQDENLFIQAHPRAKVSLSKARLQKGILLSLSPDFVSTEILATRSGARSRSSFLTTIGLLNRTTKKVFKLKRPLIENVPGSGYRFDPIYIFVRS